MIKGCISAPPSKSIAQRAIAMSFLSTGQSEIHNIGKSKDVLAALSLAKNLGAIIKEIENGVAIKGGLNPLTNHINAGESGLSLRIFSILSAIAGNNFIITGEGTLLRRPISMLENALYQGGVICNTNNGYLPMSFHGKLKSGNYHIDAAVTSQILTGLLIALPCLDGDNTISVKNLNSKPYIDITLEMLKVFGIKIKHVDYANFIIPGNQKFKPVKYLVEGDWSGGAFWFVAGAIAGDISISGLNPHSLQADKVIFDALKCAGAEVSYDGHVYRVRKSKINPFIFDATNCPDLIPILTLLGACANGTSIILGADRLQFKESNRGIVLQQEFKKLNIKIDIENGKMIVYGDRIRGGTIDVHHDHRIAMTFVIASLVSAEDIIINDTACVNKSYPEFFEHLNALMRD
ncbi:MAG: 3-phosphoshikimate 1-carboxyvinyltransferase [Bacteroidales bacterium]|jgi:3-phosphoshikimate 1-carboxyvinyltransferase|nr:3-phosphoshikimate 1-carboxyvinyltransferase [Bacteroidales bacterium]